MSVQIALLRAVNVGGTGKVPMADLRTLVESLGFRKARTLLQSGNLVFEAGTRSPAGSEKTLETACDKAFGVRTDIHVRTRDEFESLIAANPFAREAKIDPGHLHVLFMRQAPVVKAFENLQAAIKGRERVRGAGRHAYIVYPDGSGNSKLTPALIERHLGQRGTARNWNTVGKLAVLAAL